MNSVRSKPTTVKSNTNTTTACTIANLKNWTCLEKTDNYSELSHLSFGPHALVGSLAYLRRATMLHSSIHYSKRYMKPPPSPQNSAHLSPSSVSVITHFFHQENRRNQERNPIPPTSNPSIHLSSCSVIIFSVPLLLGSMNCPAALSMVNSSTCTLNPVLLECIKRHVWTLLLGLCPLSFQQYRLFLLYFILIFPRSTYTYYNCSNEIYVYVYIFYISTHVFVICPLNLYLPCPYILFPSATDLLLYFILY